MRNFPEWSVAFWGAAAAGAVVVPLNAWWTGAGARTTGWPTRGPRSLVADMERAERLAAPPRRPARPAGSSWPAARASCRLAGVRRFAEVLGPVPADAVAARRGGRHRRRRHHLLHLGHHRPAQGRARHPPQHLHQPDQPRLRQRPRGPALRPRPAGQRHGAGRPAERRTCSRSRSSTPPAATHPGGQHRRPAASWS